MMIGGAIFFKDNFLQKCKKEDGKFDFSSLGGMMQVLDSEQYSFNVLIFIIESQEPHLYATF